MDREQLENERIQRRDFMFTEGILDNTFLVVEALEHKLPDFVEYIMHEYIPQLDDYILKLQGILITKPLDTAELERLICKLKGVSATVGTGRLTTAADAMLKHYNQCNTDTNRLSAVLEEVRSQYVLIKACFEPYVQILKDLKGDIPPPPPPQDEDDEA